MKIHSRFLFFIKLIISPLIIYWLIRNEKFNYENLKLGLTNLPLFGTFLILTFTQLTIATYRTKILYPKNTFIRSSFFSLVKISWATNFVHCVAPSTIFGEVFRIKELMKRDGNENKDNSIYVSIFSKIFSTLALVFISFFSNLFFITRNNNFKIIFFISGLICLISLLAFVSHNLTLNFFTFIILKIKNYLKKDFFSKRIEQLEIYFNFLLSNKKIIIKTFLTSLIIQTLNTLSFIIIIYSYNLLPSQDLILLIALVPIGIFIMTLPISFSGLGVGHIAFSELLKIAHINNGAEIFTIYFAFSFIFNLIGAIPFITIWRK